METVDYCQHVGMGCCANLKQLIHWLGQDESWEVHRQLHFYGPDGRHRKLAALPLLPAPLHLAGWLAKWPGLLLRDRISVARGILAINRLKLDKNHERQSALEWLHRQGQSERSIENFWQTIGVSALGEELDRVNLAAVGKVLQDGFLRHRDAYHLLVPTRPLGELFDRQAQEQLRLAGVDLQFRVSVDSVSRSKQGTVAVVAGKRSFQADALVLAIPWHQYYKFAMASDNPQLAKLSFQAQQLQSSPITGVHTWWDRRWLEQPHAAIVGRICQWVFPKQQSAEAHREGDACKLGRRDFYCQIVISASRSLPRASAVEIAALIHDDLSSIFPKIRAAKLMCFKVVTDPQAVFSISPEAKDFRPNPVVCEQILVAGDWTNTGWPATMEGAILSGFRAAEILLAGWNIPTPLVVH